MDLTKVEEKLLSKFDSDKVEDLIFQASGILLTLKKANKIEDLPQKYEYWIYRACLELADREDYAGAIRYSENGYSVEFARENLSSSLIGEVYANVCFNKKA